MVAVRKNISVERGEVTLFDEVRYFFYITNDMDISAEAVVMEARQRCNQENLIEQMKNGVRALRSPLNTLNANWAFMVISALALNIKVWVGLTLPVEPEQRMQGIQGIQNAAYVGLPCEEKTEQACVAWIAEPEANTQSVESAIRQVLGQKNLPLDQVIRVEKIPLDPRHNSKVDYAALRIQLLAPN